MQILIITSIIVVVLTVAATSFVIYRMTTKGFAPGWQARCSGCGTVIPAGDIPGVVRVHTHRDFKSVASYRCETCDETRTFDIEYASKD